MRGHQGRLGEPPDWVDTEDGNTVQWRQKRRVEFESGPCHVLEVKVAHYLDYRSLSSPFCEMGIIIFTSFCGEQGKLLNLSGLLVNIISLPSLLSYSQVDNFYP